MGALCWLRANEGCQSGVFVCISLCYLGMYREVMLFDDDLEMRRMTLIISLTLASFLKDVYGIPLKWENHPKDVIWGEACIHSEAFPVFLV